MGQNTHSTTGVAATPRWVTACRFGASRTGSVSTEISNPRRHENGLLESEVRWVPHGSFWMRRKAPRTSLPFERKVALPFGSPLVHTTNGSGVDITVRTRQVLKHSTERATGCSRRSHRSRAVRVQCALVGKEDQEQCIQGAAGRA